MVGLLSLWLPILLSAVAVFVLSSVIHMALPWHKPDYRKFAAEDDVLDALRKFELAPGDYVAPLAGSMAETSTEAYKAKLARGPQIFLTVRPQGEGMGKSLVLWFVLSLVVGAFAAYVAGLALAPGAEFMIVFRIASTVAFAGYALALWQNSIWFSRSIGATFRSTVDGLVYALVTGAVFAWLWP